LTKVNTQIEKHKFKFILFYLKNNSNNIKFYYKLIALKHIFKTKGKNENCQLLFLIKKRKNK